MYTAYNFECSERGVVKQYNFSTHHIVYSGYRIKSIKHEFFKHLTGMTGQILTITVYFIIHILRTYIIYVVKTT